MPITLLDGILLGITLVSAVLAMVRGFSREVLSVVSWAAAAAAAYLFYKPVVPFLTPYISNDTIVQIAAAGLVFVVTLIVVSIITMKIADFIIDSRIGALDRTLGFLFGAARGILLVVVAMLFFNWLVPENQPAWVGNAKSKPMIDQLGAKLVGLLPEDPESTILKRLKPGTTAPEASPDATTAPEPKEDIPPEGGATNQ
ncbi:membrane protein required for colicin V production [Phyllobacterium sp. YR620]|jgi:membrane protein required for colicin V production|uniref:CvpA family protein n=1 Tax=Phyllobacterium pellucidum TaxID=2740464 RepID=A0A849VPV8_9HYPH|nr:MULTISPECIES: CvpA family protein [Phyllobacterium]MRG55828.1 CvpA family protein [Phyllobacterium sp. SYP-B3895]NTS30037.1 CvpA family protein [Phyllobacterium pellucidum]UGY08153.1 CvpA family protein [Phyllobacterium sp. T1018]SDP56940.1 membrane protein required for colicin V production [Phyllobacterium sp. YR620]SFI49632.1 membrane protein required for colicin V production [Phyllobacterium sp. CL33Tsu]